MHSILSSVTSFWKRKLVNDFLNLSYTYKIIIRIWDIGKSGIVIFKERLKNGIIRSDHSESWDLSICLLTSSHLFGVLAHVICKQRSNYVFLHFLFLSVTHYSSSSFALAYNIYIYRNIMQLAIFILFVVLWMLVLSSFKFSSFVLCCYLFEALAWNCYRINIIQLQLQRIRKKGEEAAWLLLFLSALCVPP